MSGDEPKGGAEASAQKWPPEDYTRWVQSQIADRMLKKIFGWIGGVSALTLIGMGAWLYTSYQGVVDYVKRGVIEDVTPEITEAVVGKHLPQAVTNEVVLQLIRQAGLVDAAIVEVEAQLPDRLEQRLSDRAFQEQAADRIMQAIDARGGVTRVIMENALQRARDSDAPDAVRALAVELYALLASDGTIEQLPTSYRANLLRIARARVEGPQSQVQQELLVHYPLDARAGGRAGSDPLRLCPGRENTCARQDRAMIALMLDRFLADPASQDRLEPYLSHFLVGMAAEHYSVFADRAEKHAGNPHFLTLSQALLREGSAELRIRLVTRMVDLARTPDKAAFALGALAALDPHAAFASEGPATADDGLPGSALDVERRQALTDLWTLLTASTSADDLVKVFAPGQGPLGFAEPSAESERFDPIPPARDALVLLLRTTPPADPESGENDWQHMIEQFAMTDSALGPDPAVYAAWVARARLDLARGQPVDWAADRVLEGLGRWPDRLAGGAGMLDAATFAIANAGADAFGEFMAMVATRHRTAATAAPDAVPFRELIAAAVAREKARDDYPWIAAVLDDSAGATSQSDVDGFRALVMAALAEGTDRQASGAGGLAARLGAARFAAALLERPDPGLHDVAGLALARVRDAGDEGTDGRTRCEVWAAIEDSGLAAGIATGRYAAAGAEVQRHLREIGASMGWIGRAEPGVAPTMVVPGGDHPITVEGISRIGGGWTWISLDRTLNLRMEVPPGLDLVVMDADRIAVLHRHAGATELTLQPGRYALGLRDCALRAATGELRITATDKPITVASAGRTKPHPIPQSGAFLYRNESDAGELWFEAEVWPGDVIVAETLSNGPPDVDTVLRLYRPEEEFAFLENDDVDAGYYSRIEYVSDRRERIQLQVARYGDSLFLRDDAFLLRFKFVGSDAVIAATALPGAAPAVELGAGGIVELPGTDGEPAYLALRPDTDTLVELSSAEALLTLSTLEGLAANSGGPALAPLEGGYYLLAGGTDYRVAIAAPGRRFAAIVARPHLTANPPDMAGAPLELPVPAALQLTDGLTEFSMRTSGSERTFRIAFAGPDEALRSASLKVVPATGGAAESVRLRRGADGTLEGEWLAGAADEFKVAIVFDDGPGPLTAAITASRGYMGFAVGQRVRLGRHQPINGLSLWDSAMDAYVGCLARIAALAGYENGQNDIALVQVDLPYRVDEPDWLWRVVNLEPVADTEPQPAHCPG
jgi:hypothetical protein